MKLKEKITKEKLLHVWVNDKGYVEKIIQHTIHIPAHHQQ